MATPLEKEIRNRAEMLKWRRRQKRGAIMKPSTFEGIVNKCMDDHPNWGKQRCEKVAGAAYWQTAKSKFKESKA